MPWDFAGHATKSWMNQNVETHTALLVVLTFDYSENMVTWKRIVRHDLMRIVSSTLFSMGFELVSTNLYAGLIKHGHLPDMRCGYRRFFKSNSSSGTFESCALLVTAYRLPWTW